MNSPVSIVTGAGSGIGRACARMLAERGHSLVLVGRTAHTLEETRAQLAQPDAHLVAPADVSDCARVYEVVDRTIERYGRIDALVLAAGVAPRAPIRATTQEMLLTCFSVNALGSAYFITRAWPHFARARSGRIVLVSTIGSSDPFPGFLAYAASKSAVDSFARSIRAEGAAIGVRGFAVNPGCVETAALRNNFPESVVPRERTIAPEVPAAIIVACACGERDEDNGATILVPSP